ncbi:MAG: hypothetical protein HYV97_10920 [Bdellovibrio sp.]|nr:hypothetical protein [Bdellovibrio sp.]
MKFSTLLYFYLIVRPWPIYAEEPRETAPACARFRIHLAKELPEIKIDAPSFQSKPLPPDLDKAINVWEEKIDFLKDKSERARWQSCIRQFLFLDTNKNGIPDWTALVDGRPSRSLFPLDPDIDGDGLLNLIDPDPYGTHDESPTGFIPAHLKLTGENGLWQKRLFLDLGVLAINHTDEHVAGTLEAMYSTLRLDSIRNWKKEVRGFDVLYAFNRRNLYSESAAYHPTAHAISIPGNTGFGANLLSSSQKCKFVASILHELGHALLFGIVTADVLREKAIELGGWDLPKFSQSNSESNNIWSTLFFGPMKVQNKDLVSDYAKTNVHEWFAESFAVYVWEKERLDNINCQTFNGKHVSRKLKVWFDALMMKAQGRNLKTIPPT